MPLHYKHLRIGLLFLCVEFIKLTFSAQNEGSYSVMERISPLETFKNNVEEKIHELFMPKSHASNSAMTNCIKIECRYTCVYGHIDTIAADINATEQPSDTYSCKHIQELNIFSYQFPNNTISYGFLKEYSNRVEKLYIAHTNVITIQDGAFANGIFREISLDDLALVELQKGFFTNITSYFEKLSIWQRNIPILSANSDFLDHVKYQITTLSLRIGIQCIRNVTASSNLLNELIELDISYNDFGNTFTDNTFYQLSVVEILDISHCQLTHLPDYVFASISSTLRFLDLSHNHLTTLSMNIFGSHSVLPTLQIGLHDNDWHCTCQLHNNLNEFYKYVQSKLVYCRTPDTYVGWSVFDQRICDEQFEVPTIAPCSKCIDGDVSDGDAEDVIYTTAKVMDTPRPTAIISSTTTQGILPVPTQLYDSVILECLPLKENGASNYQRVKRPTVYFDIVTGTETADIYVHSDMLSDNHGLLWFHNVTKQYYYMEINYKDYGLGCYGAISYHTTVEQLVPNECYIFCVVQQQEHTLSPFDCKSVHVCSNLQVSSWTVNDDPVSHIALIVFGVITSLFFGIGGIYLIMRRKLRGNEGLGIVKKNSKEENLVPSKDKKAKDGKRKDGSSKNGCSKGFSCRRESTDSEASYQSYMHANVYETIPAYLRFEDSFPELLSLPKAPSLKSASIQPSDSDSMKIITYAEVPQRPRRPTQDPLPEVPSSDTDKTTNENLYSHLND